MINEQRPNYSQIKSPDNPLIVPKHIYIYNYIMYICIYIHIDIGYTCCISCCPSSLSSLPGQLRHRERVRSLSLSCAIGLEKLPGEPPLGGQPVVYDLWITANTMEVNIHNPGYFDAHQNFRHFRLFRFDPSPTIYI